MGRKYVVNVVTGGGEDGRSRRIGILTGRPLSDNQAGGLIAEAILPAVLARACESAWGFKAGVEVQTIEEGRSN